MLINNTYNLDKISKITGGYCIGPKNLLIKNIYFDTRLYLENNGHLFIAIKTENNDGNKYINKAYEKGVRLFITNQKPNSPHSDAGYLIVKDSLDALQKWAAYHRRKFNLILLAITGSYGKTIIKEWIYHFLKKEYNISRSPKSYNSQLGAALSILAINKRHQIAIIEVGISKPGEMKKMKEMIQPTHVIISNIGNAHIENFENLSQISNEKEKLLTDAKYFYFNKNDINSYKRFAYNNTQKITTQYLGSKEEFVLKSRDKISAENFICSLRFLEQLKIHPSMVKKECLCLPEVALRMDKKQGVDQSIIINDSYNADLQSIKIALENLKSESEKHKTTVILSDITQEIIPKKELYKQISELINSYKINQLIGIGRDFVKNKKEFNNNFSFYNKPEDFISNLKSLDIKDHYILIKVNKEKSFQKISLKLEAKKHETSLEIDLNNIEKNLIHYKKRIPSKTKVLVMIKAAGYGAGLIEIGKKLEKINVDFLGVAYSDEGVELRKNNINAPILVMNVEDKSMEDVIENNLIPSIHDLNQLNEFTTKLIGLGIKNYPIHIKLNTGMNRMGIDIDEIDELIKFILSQPEIKVEGVFSHLAASDIEEGKKISQQQIQTFKSISEKIEENIGTSLIKHLLNTSGIENYSENCFDMVRLGIGLYGISNNLKLNNVATLSTKISKIRTVSENEQIGYGVSNISKNKITIGVIPIGYADGFSRTLGNGIGRVFTSGVLVPTVGNICMDMSFIDLSNIDAKVGDKVEIFGANNSIKKIAKSMNTIPYEILSSISQRVVRIYEKE